MRSAMREGIVDQRLARLQGRGSERERTESHRHHPIQPPFVHPRPHLSSKPTPAIPSSLVSPAACLPPFLSFHLFLSLHGSLPLDIRISLSWRPSHGSLPVSTCSSSLYAYIRVPFCTLVPRVRPCVEYVRAGTCISSICIPT